MRKVILSTPLPLVAFRLTAALAFGPNGLLFARDSIGSARVAIGTRDKRLK
jgi:hypothetical protein